MDVESHQVRDRSKPRAVVLAVSALLGAIGAVDADTRSAAGSVRISAGRTRLLTLQRDAVNQLRQAARPGTPDDQVRRALVDASRSLDAIGRRAGSR